MFPTVDEAELPGFYMSAWQAMWVPKRAFSPHLTQLLWEEPRAVHFDG